MSHRVDVGQGTLVVASPPVQLLEIENVDKHFGQVHALKSLSLSLPTGRIGLLGPNGAGKSTLLKSILGLVAPDHGAIRVLGLDVVRSPFEVRALIGYMPEGDAVIGALSALELTTLAGELCGLPRSESVARAHQVLHYVGLGEARYRPVGGFSTGMKQRARLAQALAGDPKLLLLDEPTSGFDPRGREEMLELIADIPRRTGASVILSTHILPDVERTCDHVLVLAKGEVKYAGDLATLLQTDTRTYDVRTTGNLATLKSAIEAAGASAKVRGAQLEVRVPEGADATFVLRVAGSTGHSIRHCAPLVRSLERAFFETLSA